MEKMKQISLIIFLAMAMPAVAQDAFFAQANAFFKVHVSREGLVDYEGIKRSPSNLNTLMGLIAKADLDAMSDDERKAFLINAYNIAVIQQVVDLLPLKSPLDNSKFFNGIKHEVAGQMMTLDEIEKGTLFPMYPDPRLHFVLVCAAVSCPPLAQQAFRPDMLEQQLDQRARYVLNLDWFIEVNNSKAKLSQIFNWYRGDFEKDGQKLIGYINEYRVEKIEAKRPQFYEYDWTLNAQK